MSESVINLYILIANIHTLYFISLLVFVFAGMKMLMFQLRFGNSNYFYWLNGAGAHGT